MVYDYSTRQHITMVMENYIKHLYNHHNYTPINVAEALGYSLESVCKVLHLKLSEWSQ